MYRQCGYMTRQKTGLLIVGTLLAGAFAWVVMTGGPLASTRVTIDKARAGNFHPSVFGVGTVEARRSYTLAPTMTSRVSRVLVDQGDHVKAGQVLAEMDPIDLEARVSSGRQAAERANNVVRVAEAQLREAESRARTLSATFGRYAELRSQGFVSQEMLDAKRHDKDAALAGLDVATASLAAARNDVARIRADLAGLNSLREQTRLISPVDGIVTDRVAEPGETAVPGQTIVQVIDPGSLWLKARIDQRQAGQVRAGQDAQIALRSQPQKIFPGKVERVDLVSDAVTEERIVNVVFTASPAPGGIGEYGEVTISLPDMGKVISIPSAAVKRDGVWVLRDGRARFKPVSSGAATLDGRTQIMEGLNEGDEIIVHSQQTLRDGLRVEAVAEITRGNP